MLTYRKTGFIRADLIISAYLNISSYLLSIELLAHARFYVRIRTTRGSLPHVVIIISAYCITISLSSAACAYKPGFTVFLQVTVARLGQSELHLSWPGREIGCKYTKFNKPLV